MIFSKVNEENDDENKEEDLEFKVINAMLNEEMILDKMLGSQQSTIALPDANELEELISFSSTLIPITSSHPSSSSSSCLFPPPINSSGRTATRRRRSMKTRAQLAILNSKAMALERENELLKLKILEKYKEQYKQISRSLNDHQNRQMLQRQIWMLSELAKYLTDDYFLAERAHFVWNLNCTVEFGLQRNDFISGLINILEKWQIFRQSFSELTLTFIKINPLLPNGTLFSLELHIVGVLSDISAFLHFLPNSDNYSGIINSFQPKQIDVLCPTHVFFTRNKIVRQVHSFDYRSLLKQIFDKQVSTVVSLFEDWV